MLVPVVVGPTGSGKTAVATALGALLPVEAVSADSRQVYRGLVLGTAAPAGDDRAAVPYHGIGFLDPRERYSAGRFARDAAGWIAGIAARGRTPLVVGGTGFYLRALFEGLFEEPDLGGSRRERLREWLSGLAPAEAVRWACRLDPGFAGGGAQRAQRSLEVALLAGRALGGLQAAGAPRPRGLRPWYALLTLERAALRERIVARTREMLAAGWVDEVRGAVSAGVPLDAPGLSAVGYREIVAHLCGAPGGPALEAAIVAATARYAKRQETWFRHQLRGPVARLDARESAAALARLVAAGYRAAAEE